MDYQSDPFMFISGTQAKSAETADHFFGSIPGRGTRMVGDPGAFSAGDTLVPIPNTTVKTRSGDDTLYGESSSVPDYLETTRKGGFWCL